MAILNRNKLKQLFNKGQKPKEEDYHNLIDSFWNKSDEPLRFNRKEGLVLQNSYHSKNLISFHHHQNMNQEPWSICWGDRALQFVKGSGDKVLNLHENGNVGVGVEVPQFPLEVNGLIGSKGRAYNWSKGTVPADGKWHDISPSLCGCHILEITAGVGKKLSGRYALIYAVGLLTFGQRRNKIKTLQSYYGSRTNQLKLRWKGDTFEVKLQIKTVLAYDPEVKISYQIGQLWEDHEMLASWNK